MLMKYSILLISLLGDFSLTVLERESLPAGWRSGVSGILKEGLHCKKIYTFYKIVQFSLGKSHYNLKVSFVLSRSVFL